MWSKWVDRNKGSDDHPEVKSRLVAQEFASKDREGLFAATPPLGAARAMLSLAASQRGRRPGPYQIMLLDVKKAFLYGNIQRRVHIELPFEDPGTEGGRMVGMLPKAMYGLRKAPRAWYKRVKRDLEALGWRAHQLDQCVFSNMMETSW